MTTKVINIHHKVSYDVYIGRGSIWGNPYSHMPNTTAKFKVTTREEAVNCYREYIKAQPDLLTRVCELKGKTLGCFCMPNLCHGSILAELANKI